MRELTYVRYPPRKARKKPGPTARKTAKKRRAEGPVKTQVRAACVERDELCRVWSAAAGMNSLSDEVMPLVECRGRPEWAHLGEGKRFKTRGMKPEQRHCTARSLILCKLHHDRYDGRVEPRMEIVELTDRGADGPLLFK